MNDEQAKRWAIIITFGIVAVLWIIAWVQLQIIYLNRGLFWIALILIPICFIGFIVSLVSGIKDEWFDEMYIFLTIGCAIIFLIAIFSIDNFYQKGYSDQALQKEAELKKQMAEYGAILDLLTLQPIEDATNQAIEETIDSMCQDPNYPCQQMKANFIIYKELKGWKDTADTVAKVARFKENRKV